MTTDNLSTKLVVTPKPRRGRTEPSPYRSQRRSAWSSIWRHALMILVVIVSLYPILWMVASSLRPEGAIFDDPSLWLTTFEWENYTHGWTALGTPFGQYLINSLIVVLGSIIGNLFSCSLAAYAFARLRFRFKTPAFAYMLITLMLPIHVLIVPQYILWSQVGLNDSFWPLIVPKFLATERGFEDGEAGLMLGATTVIGGLLGTIAGGVLGDKLEKRKQGGSIWMSGVGLSLAAPMMVVAVHSESKATLLLVLLAAQFFIFLNQGPLNAAIVNVVSPGFRAFAFSVSTMTLHLLGDAASPTIIGWISDTSKAHGGPGLATAIQLNALPVLLGGVVLLLGAKSFQKREA